MLSRGVGSVICLRKKGVLVILTWVDCFRRKLLELDVDLGGLTDAQKDALIRELAGQLQVALARIADLEGRSATLGQPPKTPDNKQSAALSFAASVLSRQIFGDSLIHDSIGTSIRRDYLTIIVFCVLRMCSTLA